jgi:hypothetical protein
VNKKDDDGGSPWLKGVPGVKGIVPPGRRLSGDARATRWSASGVRGVRPPGGHGPGEGPATEWVMGTAKKKRKLRERANQGKKKGDAIDPMRPTAGVQPDVFKQMEDPEGIEGFLKNINQFVSADPPEEPAMEDIAQLITQSSAPFEIAVGFAMLTAATGTDEDLRDRFHAALERGAKVFYNLAKRLDATVQIPRGLAVRTVDTIFYDLPDSAYAVPFAFATLAFLESSELLVRNEPSYDAKLGAYEAELYAQFVESRTLGDAPLKDLFPWTPRRPSTGGG